MIEAVLAGIAFLLVLAALNLVLLLRRAPASDARTGHDALAVLEHRLAAAHRMEADSVRQRLERAERTLLDKAEQGRFDTQATLAELQSVLLRDGAAQREQLDTRLREHGERAAAQGNTATRDLADQRLLLEGKLREMAEHSTQRLDAIRASVNEQLAASIGKQMETSFQRVLDQFAAVQKAMGDVQAVTGQIGDLKRIFTNVKSRGGWGEAQLRALLEDLLPEGGWEANRKLRLDSDDIVEFVLVMPASGQPRPLLALDAKFPVEDYDRLLTASEDGDPAAERLARKSLETRLRGEAAKIASKYIVPGVTVDYAVMYLPTDGLYVEAARMPGLIETVGREHRVLVVGPSLLPALVRTVAVGAMSLTIAENAGRIERILGAVRHEFGKIDEVMARLEKQSGAMNRTVTATRTRTRAMDRQLRSVQALNAPEAAEVLALAEAEPDDEE